MAVDGRSLRTEPRTAATAVAVAVSDALMARRLIAVLAAAEPRTAIVPLGGADVVVVAEEGPQAELARRLDEVKHQRPHAAVVVVSRTSSAGRCQRLLDQGVDGVVLAAAVDGALASAVAAVAAGHLVQPRCLMRARGAAALSHREKQVLGLVVLGFANGEIGRQLFLAESTVKSHMQSIFAKLGVGSRKQAVAAVLDSERGLGLGVLALTDAGEAHAQKEGPQG